LTEQLSTLKTVEPLQFTIVGSAPLTASSTASRFRYATMRASPFGFGYRRCPGEQLTIQVFEDFLRKVWKDNIEFQKLDIASPEPLPIGPTTVIGDNVGFIRVA